MFMSVAKEVNPEFESPQIFHSDESGAHQLAITTQAQKDIESMLASLATVDEHVYEELKWGNQKPECNYESLSNAWLIVELALKQNNVTEIADNDKALYVLLLIASLPLTFKIYARLYRIFNNRALTPRERYHVNKMLDSISLLNDAPGQLEYCPSTLPSDCLALNEELQSVVRQRVEAAVRPVTMLSHLMTTDYEYLSGFSPIVAKTKFNVRARAAKSASRTRSYFVRVFKDTIKDAFARIDTLTEQLKETRTTKQKQIRELKKELNIANDAVRKVQESDPLSDLFGLNFDSQKDEELANLTLRIEQLETRNTELQKENNRLHKQVVQKEFSVDK
tara:strand:+ start:489 stop:1496 length:1008 start_codon:yes stop_codon:yes gene_type:complete